MRLWSYTLRNIKGRVGPNALFTQLEDMLYFLIRFTISTCSISVYRLQNRIQSSYLTLRLWKLLYSLNRIDHLDLPKAESLEYLDFVHCLFTKRLKEPIQLSNFRNTKRINIKGYDIRVTCATTRQPKRRVWIDIRILNMAARRSNHVCLPTQPMLMYWNHRFSFQIQRQRFSSLNIHSQINRQISLQTCC